jgi:LMBR1 domain-containing protein 1
MYSYYALYGVVFALLFAVIPFVYFYFEEKNDDGFGNENRLCTAFKYTIGFVFVAIILMMVGAFVPLRESPPLNATSEWEKIEFLFDDLGKNRGEDALSMVLSILSVLGMVNLIFYTGFGIFSWPMGLIRGTRSAKNQFEEIQDKHLVNQTRINTLKDRERVSGRLTDRERRQLAQLEDEERQNTREEQAVDEVRQTLWYKCRLVLRPLEVVIGVVLGILALLIWISLLLTNIDKAMHSLGPKLGYALPKRTLPNPLDIILVYLQRVFPLDYILIFIITWFLVLATLSGIRNLGVRILFFPLYKLKYKRTRPQGLLMACVTLMLTVLAVNIFLYFVSPQYATYGSQKYISTNVTGVFSDEFDSIESTNVTVSIIPCDSNARPDTCIMTRNSALLTRFFYKAWFFGAIYYWCSWVFIAVSGLAAFYVVIREPKTVTDGINDEDELEESEDEGDLLTRRSSSRVR